jgi:hypothetical protein
MYRTYLFCWVQECVCLVWRGDGSARRNSRRHRGLQEGLQSQEDEPGCWSLQRRQGNILFIIIINVGMNRLKKFIE